MEEVEQTHKDLVMWAKGFSQKKMASIDYYLENGNATEKALMEKVLELAQEK